MNRIIINSDRCKGCGLCVTACPKNIVQIDEHEINAKGYNPVHAVNMEECTACALCATMCPDCVITVEKE